MSSIILTLFPFCYHAKMFKFVSKMYWRRWKIKFSFWYWTFQFNSDIRGNSNSYLILARMSSSQQQMQVDQLSCVIWISRNKKRCMSWCRRWPRGWRRCWRPPSTSSSWSRRWGRLISRLVDKFILFDCMLVWAGKTETTSWLILSWASSTLSMLSSRQRRGIGRRF